MIEKHGNTEKLAGNKNAVKTEDEKATSMLVARVKTEDKARWVKAAQGAGLKLTEWVIKTLNDKAPPF